MRRVAPEYHELEAAHPGAPEKPPLRAKATWASARRGPLPERRCAGSAGRSYCRSYTAMLVSFLPAPSVMFVVSVRVLPSAEISMVAVTTGLPPFLLMSS